MEENVVVPGQDAQAEPASRWEDVIDVFIAPADLFRRRAADRVAPPLITLLVAAVIIYFVMLPANAIVMRASVAQNEQAAQAIEQWGIFMQVIGSIFVPISYLVVIFSAAALLWLVGRFTEIRTDFSRTTLIATYAAYTLLLGQVAVGALVLLHGEVGLEPARHLSLGVLRFTGTDGISPGLVPLLRRIDLFNIWQAALWAIGVRIVFRTSAMQAALTAGAVWILFAVPGLIAAALGIGQAAGG